MATNSNSNEEIINEIERNIPIINEKIVEGLKTFRKYSKYFLKEEKYKENPNEKDPIKKAESTYGRLDDIIRRNALSNKKAIEVIELLDKMKKLFNGIFQNTQNERKELAVRNNKLIETIIHLEERKTVNLILENTNKKDFYKERLFDKIYEWNKKNLDLYCWKQLDEENLFRRMNITSDCDEIKQIEEWTGMKVGNIIFDSDVDNWKQNSSVFDQKIINKSNLIFLIEDEDDNIFGGYVNAKIDKIYPRNIPSWIEDSKAFLFSLKSNGRLKKMMKFNNINHKNTFSLHNYSYENGLFVFGYDGMLGNDIRVHKENTKTQSWCSQKSFNYNGIQNALCGKSNFNPQRIIVIQLI